MGDWCQHVMRGGGGGKRLGRGREGRDKTDER